MRLRFGRGLRVRLSVNPAAVKSGHEVTWRAIGGGSPHCQWLPYATRFSPTTHRPLSTKSYGAMSKVALFFSSYSNFTLNEDAAVTKEFLRLKKLKRWKDGDDEYTEARDRFADALAEDFNAMYGTNIDDIENWRVLCHVLKIDPVPEDIKACRKAVKSKHVNLVDLVQHRDKVRVFSTVKELAEYSKKQEKIFLKQSAKAGGILRYLLRPIFGGGS